MSWFEDSQLEASLRFHVASGLELNYNFLCYFQHIKTVSFESNMEFLCNSLCFQQFFEKEVRF